MSLRVAVMMAAAGLFTGAVAWADDIQLKNGQTYTGSVSRVGDKMVIRADDGRTITVAPEDIAAVRLNDAVSPEQAAAAEWTRIVQRIKAADDLQTIITLHKGFLDKFPDTPQAGDVKSSLAVYQKLSENDGVKFRGRWIPRAQIEVMVGQWKESAKAATELYRHGQYKEAIEAVKAALTSDGQNPDALVVAGLSAFHLNDARAARTYFTTLITADPASLLSENNLAVVAGVQKLPAEALQHYTRALAINPNNRLLLDNIQEALGAYLAGGGDKDAPPYVALLRQFKPAEKKMEDRMAQDGLYRWGASWVTRAQLDGLNAYQTRAKAEAAQLQSQYDTARNVISGIEDQMKKADADIESELQAVNYYNGQLAINQAGVGLNNAVFASQRDAAAQNLDRSQRYKADLQAEHDRFMSATKDYFVQADKVKAALAGGPGQESSGHTGKQRIMEIGEDETPPDPARVSDPPPLPEAPALPPIVLAPPPVQPPTIVQVLVPVTGPIRRGN